MSFFGAIFKAADLILAGAQVVDRGIDLGKKIARKLKSPTKPREPSQPLSHRDVTHIQGQIRSATTQRFPTLRPPPPRRRPPP